MKRAASIALYALFIAVWGEASLQLFYRYTAGDWLWSRTGTAVPIYRSDPDSGVFNRANIDLEHRTNEFRARYVTNSEGFRVAEPSREFARPKPPGVFRVMLVGASFAYGWGVDLEDSFAGRLEAGLAGSALAGGRRVEVLNAGVPSLPEIHQRAWFEANAAPYQPDLVIQLEYGTLLIPNQAPFQATPDGYLMRTGVNAAGRVRDYVKRLATVFYGFVVVAQFRASQEVVGAGRVLPPVEAFSLERADVRSSLAYFEAMRAAARAAGAGYQVVYYPLSYAVHPQDVSRWRHLGVHDPAAQAVFDARLCAEISRRGVPCHNGTEALKRAGADSAERLYYWIDIHWTRRGNEVAAQHALRSIERSAPADANP